MSYREVGGRRKFYTLSECEKGQILVEGKYLSEVMGRFGKQFEFESLSGEIVCIGGKHLEYKMQFVKPGTKCKVVYDGCVTLTKGVMKGKQAHQFIVFAEDIFDESDEAETPEESEGVDEFNGLL